MIHTFRLILSFLVIISITVPAYALNSWLQSAANSSRGGKTESADSAFKGWTEPLASANPPDGFKELRGIITMAIQPGGLFGITSDVIALFEDGSYSSDLKTLFAKGKSASMSKKPGRWGRWKISGDELLLKKKKSKDFSETRGNWVARPASSDLKLNGCYGKLTTASESPFGGNYTVGRASSWCFKPNGRFAHSRTGFAVASGEVSGGTSTRSKRGGRYRIDGYTARFLYDDGTELVTAFCFLNEKRSHIAINGKRYMGSD
ncbi:MAG: hypothetical protein B6D72_06915 [gamma proteobacterium symbiont of Ctena orbiculata]|nr:hypothetical protein [Candidatus Thiodiazotropha taylori]PVV12925.1 MAG: hypothetical protein B6D72_06915 [gamma proteobacterium symbiont of Ctena orbiculata]